MTVQWRASVSMRLIVDQTAQRFANSVEQLMDVVSAVGTSKEAGAAEKNALGDGRVSEVEPATAHRRRVVYTLLLVPSATQIFVTM